MINIDNYTESDVEMKIILPLLKDKMPEGLQLEDYHIQTKSSLKKILIDKGTSQKLYYPDFAITILGVPLLIVEAKKPNEDLDEAYRQACLYANEINREFPKNINPCQLVIASDGIYIYAGNSDTNIPEFKIERSNWINTNVEFDSFLNKFSFNKLENTARNFRAKIGTGARFKNPINLLGGKKIRNLESSNSFGENISIQYRHLFNPNLEVEKNDIVKNAYVKLNKVESHILPIDNIFNKRLFDNEGTLIYDFENPTEITSKFENPKNLNNQVLLLIGSVGSGKSTFTTYLKEVALQENIRESTHWINLNLNDAPVNKEEIYKWTKKTIINNIKIKFNDIEFDSLSFILELYKEEIISLKKGVLSLFDESEIKYKELLAENILKYQNDIDLTLDKYILRLINEKKKELVIVLDNCDKRNVEEQLLMFEVANWLKDNIKTIVFLPIRDTTYENHKYDKPLDTVVKDLIFKINPPNLEQVLASRIGYISKLSNNNKDGFYLLDNGIKVKYPSKDEEKYLKSILNSLFNNNFFKKLISGFAGRNIRNGIEIFLDFCKSGHINEAEITKIIKSNSEYILPNHLISKVFIRGNKVYYTDSNSRIKNLFYSVPSDEIPDPFVRVSILKYLFDNRYTTDAHKSLTGYIKTDLLLKFLNSLGHDENRTIEELKLFLRLNLIENESLNPDFFNTQDLIKITSIGLANYEIIRNIDYLASVAEDMWYKDNILAEEITSNLSGNGEYAHLSIQSVSLHSRQLLNYLENYYKTNFSFINGKIIDTDFAPIDFNLLNSDINDFNKNIKTDSKPNLSKEKIYEASVLNIQHYGMICEIVDTSFFGLIHVSELPEDFLEKYSLGNTLKIKVKEFKTAHNKYNLVLAK
ncbi:type I restriction endonuclease [Flavobacterium granuli]|uniref:Type I restriction and modification enzyme subunit R-like protein n=1 Tax=Flavobacterium granuli TaxID=280093 RepID=A0A1M5NH37_9FLAO|nr:type I restriction endonuclease [Flavobacterium granuli]PRZ23281.1 type I restriction and modification enzyme subunit R-like protein [Flavobacterium granuli]SHG88896.1 Type I restriction enzyme R protein N terminus (HSDR_N) [Flavobacterium granuli]